MDRDELAEKLAAIGKRIEQARQKLEHHGIFSRDHQITQKELDERFRTLQRELEDEVTSLEASHEQVSQLEDTLLNWLNAIELDFE